MSDKLKIKRSPTADTRTCDWTKVTKNDLLRTSYQHIKDVQLAMQTFSLMLQDAAASHDHTKITGIDKFHSDFATGFKSTQWWDNHRVVERHHLEQTDGVPEDVNLIDVLEFIADCVMAGMARSGSVRQLIISDDTLRKAFNNTANMIASLVVVEDGGSF